MAGTHSLWSPSGAKRWRTCPGSVVMNDGVPDTTSKYAAEGTAYHALSERALRGGPPLAGRVGETIEADGFKFTVTEELADYAQEYVDRIRARASAGCIIMVEVRTDTSDLLGIPGQTGTIDARIFDVVNETLEVTDLKFGAGVKVYVCEPDDGRPLWQRVNDQAGIYGTSEWYRTPYMCDWKFLKLAIHQPRLGHYDEVTLTRADVEAFAQAVNHDAARSWLVYQQHRVDAGGLLPHLTPSLEACRWCARAGSCKARANSILEMFP